MKGDIKKKIAIIIIIGLFLIAFLTCVFIYFLNEDSHKNLYLYDITIDNDIIKVYQDKIIVNDEELNYSHDSIQKFIKFVDNNFDVKSKKIDVQYNTLNDYNALVVDNIINKANENEFITSIEDCLYSVYLSYEDNNYIIYLKDNDLVHVKKVKLSDNKLNIMDIEDSYDIELSKDANNEIVSYIKSLFIDNREVKRLYKDTVTSDEEKIINSIINNNEDYLENKDDVYTLKYSGLNCLTPVLYLYPDNTYEYYYTFTTEDKERTPIKGVFSINIEDLINLSLNTPEDYTVNYVLQGQGNTYFIDASLDLINTLLSETNATLMTCLVQE